MEAVTGIPAATVREVARAYARGPNSIIFWGMGVRSTPTAPTTRAA